MGAGIAKEFKNRYPEMFVEYAKLCKKGRIRVGEVWVWCESESHHVKPNYIVNFPTKDDWKQPSQLNWIVAGLDNLKNHVIMKEIASLAMPALGCNLGGLKFADVRMAVENSLGDGPVAVTLFEPR
jgi:O-acetyl-ADP-ribose deacetylase (regulator of RNase III)